MDKLWTLLGWLSHIKVELQLRMFRRSIISIRDMFRDLFGFEKWQ